MVTDKLVDGPLPLLVVRTSADQEARAGRLHCLKVEVRKPVGSRITKPATEVSFDDGGTWRRVPIIAGHAVIPHPSTPRFRGGASHRA